MLARLTVISGAKTKHINLHLPTIIGRGGDAKIKLPSSTVSRLHCEVYDYEGQIAVRDLDSSNGTIVNGHRIEGPTFVTADDEVTIGPLRFQLAYVSDVAAGGVPDSTEDSSKTGIPNLEKLPSSTSVPVQAEEASAAAMATESDEIDRDTSEDEGSVLQYVEPETDGVRSFVGIVPADGSRVSVAEVPRVQAESESPNAVLPDDSSLQSFLKNLDE